MPDYGINFENARGHLALDQNYQNLTLVFEETYTIPRWHFGGYRTLRFRRTVATPVGGVLRASSLSTDGKLYRHGHSRTIFERTRFGIRQYGNTDSDFGVGWVVGTDDVAGQDRFLANPLISEVVGENPLQQWEFSNPTIALQHPGLDVAVMSVEPGAVQCWVRPNTMGGDNRTIRIKVFVNVPPVANPPPDVGMRVYNNAGRPVFDSTHYYMDVRGVAGVGEHAGAPYPGMFYVPLLPTMYSDSYRRHNVNERRCIGRGRLRVCSNTGAQLRYTYLTREALMYRQTSTSRFQLVSRVLVNDVLIHYHRASITQRLIEFGFGFGLDVSGMGGIISNLVGIIRRFEGRRWRLPPGDRVEEGQVPVLLVRDVNMSPRKNA